MKKKLFSNQEGQTFLEILVALAAAVLIATAFVTLGATSVRNSIFSKNQTTATQLAQEAIEAMISIRDQNTINGVRGVAGIDQWTDLFGLAMNCTGIDFTSPCLNNDFILRKEPFGTPLVEQHYIERNGSGQQVGTAPNIFTRKIRITDSGTNIKSVTAFVWWTDAQGIHNSALTREIRKDKLQ